MNPDNKRNEKRRTLVIYLDCIDLTKGDEVGKVIDVTNEGFMLLSNSSLELESRSQFEIKLPNTEIFKNKKLIAEATCCWKKKEKLQDIYHMGMSFSEQIPDNISIIELLISTIGFSDGQKKILSTPGDFEYK